MDSKLFQVMADFCPFGSLDIAAAIKTCEKADKNISFIYESISEFAESCDMAIEDCDPNYCVYDALMQEARNEIIDLIDFDLCNDADFEVFGNYMCTSYNTDDKSKELLRNALQNAINGGLITETDLSQVVKWLLSENDIVLTFDA